MSAPFWKLFNSGTSEGVKKSWATRKGGSGGPAPDDFMHHRMMAGYHEAKWKQAMDTHDDFKSSSDPDIRAAAAEHLAEADRHGKVREEHMAKARALHNPSTHGHWNDSNPTDQSALDYGVAHAILHKKL